MRWKERRIPVFLVKCLRRVLLFLSRIKRTCGVDKASLDFGFQLTTGH